MNRSPSLAMPAILHQHSDVVTGTCQHDGESPRRNAPVHDAAEQDGFHQRYDQLRHNRGQDKDGNRVHARGVLFQHDAFRKAG